MYNLIVGVNNGISSSRMYESTSLEVKEWLLGGTGFARLETLPTLVMPEIGDSGVAPFAQVGRLEKIRVENRMLAFSFIPNPAVPDIPVERVAQLADTLGIDGPYELQRTHWAIKDADLYGALLNPEAAEQKVPRAITIPRHLPRENDLVAVMMPFAGFDRTYEAIRGAVEDVGLRCFRADDIWENHQIMDDVLSLIWRARIVVSDFSKRNPNVFYETGLAHALERDVVPIAQALDDVPFDLRSIRTLTYLPNGEGFAKLRTDLGKRLQSLA